MSLPAGASIVEEVVDVELFDDEEELMKNYEAFAKLREFWDSLSNLRKYHESEIALKDEKVCEQTNRQTGLHVYKLTHDKSAYSTCTFCNF